MLRFQSFLTPAATNSIKLAMMDPHLSAEQKDRHVATKAHDGAVKRKEAKDQLFRLGPFLCPLIWLDSLTGPMLAAYRGSSVGMNSAIPKIAPLTRIGCSSIIRRSN